MLAITPPRSSTRAGMTTIRAHQNMIPGTIRQTSPTAIRKRE
jgi:hypothetical protein